MVSLFEQYETETQKTNEFSDDTNSYRSGYIPASLNPVDNEDIFKSQKIQINIQDKTIDQFEKCGGLIAILFKPCTIRLLHPELKTDETIEYPDVINKFFLDKYGRHLLVATEKNEFYYYSKITKKIKSISKLKGNLVTAVGWNKNSTEKTTDSILVGTNKGLLFELIINSTNEGILSTFGESYCKLVYNFNTDQAISSIEIVHFKKENNYSGPSIENIYDIFVATSKRLYEFIGSDAKSMLASSATSAANIVSNLSTTPIFTSIFSYYETKTPSELANYHEMPGDLGHSQLHIRNSTKARKKTLAWMAGAGVLIFELDPFSLAKFSAANYHNESIKRLINESNHDIISYPNAKEDHYVDLGDNDPIGISLTEFHIAIFYKTQVKIICLLNKEIVLNQKLDTKSIGGKLKGVWHDPISMDFGSYTGRSIIKYVANKESRKIWKIYLNKNAFDLAKQYCMDNPANLNIVLTKQAENLFNNKKYIESAVYYAQTQNSFEEICLKYLELGNFTALRTFLTHKLNTLDADKELTQTTVVIAYIIEIFLNQLSDLIQEKLYDDYDSLHKEFYKFLDGKKVKSCLIESKEAIYKIFASHGNTSDMVYFAEVMSDYPQIIMHYIQEENYRKALEALAKQF
ncbi:unnamed protein product [Brachionus calyciflorus]|uniref:Pep3/Vps18 beta-propeller domain-containing protein n=2 Tax=Brachionus calyciflorus TaxID=104777 RepID=A0A814JH33_9BILA|nr:unnamed protein product [Brachionus calyciflorus]